jgi:hypothetical protein
MSLTAMRVRVQFSRRIVKVTLVSSRFRTALSLPRREYERKQLVRSCIFLKLSLSYLLSVVFPQHCITAQSQQEQKMFVVFALRAAIAVVNTCAAIKKAITVAGHGKSKTHSAPVDTKHFIQGQQVHDTTADITTVGALKAAVAHQLQLTIPRNHQLLFTQHAHNTPSAAVPTKTHRTAFYAQVERITCAGLVRQHTVLHLHIPEDLLEGFCVEVRTQNELKLFIPGFEQIQMEKWDVEFKPLDPHQEPIYWKKFILVVDYRFLYDNRLPISGSSECLFQGELFPSGPHEEPENLKRRRRPPPRFIQLPPSDFNISVPTEALPVIPKIITDDVGILEERVAFYKNREENGQPELHQGEDFPDAPDYCSHHLFQAAYNWNLCHQAYERDPDGLMKWFEENPEKEEQSNEWRRGAEKFRKEYPADFEKCFTGSIESDEEFAARMAAELEVSRPPSPLTELSLPSPTLSFPSSSFEKDSEVTPDDRRWSSDTGYTSSWGFDIDADGVTSDEAVIHAKISRRRWSDNPGGNNYLAHDSCTFIVDYAHKKMAEIFQSQGYLGYDELEARFGAFGYDQRLYGPLPQRE